jgi:hypothetical protein
MREAASATASRMTSGIMAATPPAHANETNLRFVIM